MTAAERHALMPGESIMECNVRGYVFIARYEGWDNGEAEITPLHPNGTSNPGPAPNITFYHVRSSALVRELTPRQVAAWEYPKKRY